MGGCKKRKRKNLTLTLQTLTLLAFTSQDGVLLFVFLFFSSSLLFAAAAAAAGTTGFRSRNSPSSRSPMLCIFPPFKSSTFLLACAILQEIGIWMLFARRCACDLAA